MENVLVKVMRGGQLESLHSGYISLTDENGNKRGGVGNTDLPTYLRSSAKPFQAYPFVKKGGIEKFDLTQEELAIMCSSHNAEEKHVEIVDSLLKKIGLGRSLLKCGPQPPMFPQEADKLARKNIEYEAVHNNCSGKHAGMLALALLIEADPENYLTPESPVQKEILDTIAEFSNTPSEEIPISLDGCSAPIFYLPLYKFSIFFGLLAQGADANLRKIRDAMITYPFHIAGTGRFDTDFMQATGGRFVSKTGAEGIQCVGIIDGGTKPEYNGWGLTVKMLDGSLRSKGPAAVKALNQMGLLSKDELNSLENHYRTKTYNWAGRHVGELIPEFQLNVE
ncbi:MAG: asparaginase [bacterium]|nr:asparaginase [bacterium]